MSEEMLRMVLDALTTYGAPAVGVFIFLVSLGVPLPGSMSLVAAGAFVRQGHLDLFSVVVLAFLGGALGDNLGFAFGRFASEGRRQRWNSRPTWGRIVSLFNRYGFWVIVLLRTLFTSITLPFNLFFGISGLSYRRFLLLDVTGVLLWVMVYIGMGYLLGEGIISLGGQLSNFYTLVLAVLLLAAGIYLWRRSRKSG